MRDSASSNATERPSLRIVMIGLSIRSDWRNPEAHTHRVVMRALQERGHDVVFLEERRNAAVEGLMRSDGAGAVLSFDEEYPDIRYRSYDPPSSRELGVWLGLEASTADVIILLTGAPQPLNDLFDRLQAPHVVRLLEHRKPDHSVLVDLSSGIEMTAYYPLIESGAAIADAIERSWAAGIRR